MGDSNNKTCFVIIGYGEKTDPLSQRHINLDRVFENIILPVFQSFDDPKFDCFRACDKNFGGVIDAQMYKWIMEADFVIADISTLNPNAIYELGIRHALRPFSTLVIAEDGIREFPFDINHVKIEKYKHLGEDIGVGEARRFIKLLTSKIHDMLKEQVCDSPVYTFINSLKPPYLATIQDLPADQETKARASVLKENKSKKKNDSLSLAELVSRAENEMKSKNYKDAIRHLKEASARDKQNLYLKHKLILATYKSEIPDKENALIQAKNLIEKYFNMKRTVDRNILELAGIVYRNLANAEYKKANIDSLSSARSYVKQSAIAFNKAYVIADDLNVGAQYGYVLVMAAAMEEDIDKKFQFFTQAILVWQRLYDRYTYIYNDKKSQKSSGKYNSLLLEKVYQALVVLNKNKESEEIEIIKRELAKVHEEQQSTKFYEGLSRLNNYADLVRNSLGNYRPKAFEFQAQE